MEERKKGGKKKGIAVSGSVGWNGKAGSQRVFLVMNLASFRGWPKATTKTNFMHLADDGLTARLKVA